MDSYIDVHIHRTPELETTQIMNTLFRKFHKALVQTKCTTIGVSFPKHGAHHLGDWLRLHGPSPSLSEFMKLDWLQGMNDYLEVSDISSAPTNSEHRTVSRVQAKSNPERLRRRAMRRHGIDEATATARIPDTAVETLSLPYVKMVSTSSSQHFRLFIRHGPVQNIPNIGKFSGYGLSTGTTVPWF
jgi:CRISPR-associated endonuclease Csy4